MVTTSGKVVIVIGVIVMFLGLFFAMSSLVALFMVFAGIVTIIQGARMQPLAVTSDTNTQATRDYYNNPNSHYGTDLSDTWTKMQDILCLGMRIKCDSTLLFPCLPFLLL